MPQLLVPAISALGTAVGGTFGASLIMYAGAYSLGPAIIGHAISKGKK